MNSYLLAEYRLLIKHNHIKTPYFFSAEKYQVGKYVTLNSQAFYHSCCGNIIKYTTASLSSSKWQDLGQCRRLTHASHHHIQGGTEFSDNSLITVEIFLKFKIQMNHITSKNTLLLIQVSSPHRENVFEEQHATAAYY